MTKRLTIALVALVALVLVAVLPASATFYSVNSTINQGATIFYGEQGLNITHALNLADKTATGTYYGGSVDGAINQTDAYVSWWASAASVTTTSPAATVSLAAQANNLYVLPSTFAYTNAWYLSTSTGAPVLDASGKAIGVFSVQDPSLAVNIWDNDQALNVNSGTVIQSENLTIRVDNNLYAAITSPALRSENDDPLSIVRADGNVNDSTYWMDIKVKTASGNTLTKLFTDHGTAGYTGNTISLTERSVNAPQWFLNGNAGSKTNNWATDALDSNGQLAYPAGTYTVWAESYMNGMKDNYLSSGAAYTGKTVAQTQTITLVSNTVSISANVDSVVRSKQFSVTITGKPNMVYHLWVKGTSSMSGTYDNQPPMIVPNQAGLTQDPALFGPDMTITPNTNQAINGNYTWQNGAGLAIYKDVCNSSYTGNGTYVYGNVSMSSSGTRTIAFTTTNWTRAQQYTIRVEQSFGSSTGYKSDEVQVTVAKGAVTIVAAGDQSYYLGEEVKFSGTNTESQTTYLFISGPNLGSSGAGMAPSDNNPRAWQLQD